MEIIGQNLRDGDRKWHTDNTSAKTACFPGMKELADLVAFLQEPCLATMATDDRLANSRQHMHLQLRMSCV